MDSRLRPDQVEPVELARRSPRQKLDCSSAGTSLFEAVRPKGLEVFSEAAGRRNRTTVERAQVLRELGPADGHQREAVLEHPATERAS